MAWPKTIRGRQQRTKTLKAGQKKNACRVLRTSGSTTGGPIPDSLHAGKFDAVSAEHKASTTIFVKPQLETSVLRVGLTTQVAKFAVSAPGNPVSTDAQRIKDSTSVQIAWSQTLARHTSGGASSTCSPWVPRTDLSWTVFQPCPSVSRG